MELSEITLLEGEQTIALPSGGWAVLRNPADVPERKRRPILDLVVGAESVRADLAALSTIVGDRSVADIDPSEIPLPSATVLEMASSMMDLLIVACVRVWSYGDVVVDVLLDIPGRDFDCLRDVTAPLFDQVVPDFSMNGGVTKGGDGAAPVVDWQSPTEPSSV